MRTLAIVAVLGLLASAAGAASLSNGSFESGLTGWTVSDASKVSAVTQYPNSGTKWYPTDGSKFAKVATDDCDTWVKLSQNFNVDSPATLSFDYFFDAKDGFFGLFKADAAGKLDEQVLFLTSADSPAGVWTSKSYAISSGNYKIEFKAKEAFLGSTSYLGVDNVKVVEESQGGAIPEPLTMLAVFSGVAGLAGYVRRRTA